MGGVSHPAHFATVSPSSSGCGRQTCQREPARWWRRPWTTVAPRWWASAPTCSRLATTWSRVEAARPGSPTFPGWTAGELVASVCVDGFNDGVGSRLTPCLCLSLCHRGRFPEWYNKQYGHIAAAEVARIRDSFAVPTDKS